MGSWHPSEFPNLDSSNHAITSSRTRRYNCIAWAAGEVVRKWWPDNQGIGWWPISVPREETLDAFILAYGTLGFNLCVGSTFEPGIEKIAIFGIRDLTGKTTPTHAAIQLESGEWSSKLGDFEDISHLTPEAVSGPVYGEVACYLSRPRPVNPHPANLLRTPTP